MMSVMGKMPTAAVIPNTSIIVFPEISSLYSHLKNKRLIKLIVSTCQSIIISSLDTVQVRSSKKRGKRTGSNIALAVATMKVARPKKNAFRKKYGEGVL
jgi:hypothetical protein